MIQAAFISDLHLHPDLPVITRYFDQCLDWIGANRIASVYILGDFFHAWAGDDTMDAWSESIAEKLKRLTSQGTAVFFMHGNRDFLLGVRFITQAGMAMLIEPAFITLGSQRVLLAHGDRYCTRDRAHQRFRRLTRNAWFSRIFLCLPRAWRMKLVARVRQHSQRYRPAAVANMEVVLEALMRHAKKYQADVVIHGHTHQPMFNVYRENNRAILHIVLSDWEENPPILCYDDVNGFYFHIMK